jgi:hypothetical protein
VTVELHHAIHKFPFLIGDEVRVLMPKGARILSVDQQAMTRSDMLQLWAQVDLNEQSMAERKLLVYGTGHKMLAEPGRFIGTVLTQGGALVWHIYDAGEVR